MIFNSAAGQGHHSKLASAACAVFKMETAPVQPTSISVRTWGGYFLYDASSPSLPVSVSTLSCRPHKFVYFCRHRAYLPDFDCSPDVVKCKSELMLDLSLGPVAQSARSKMVDCDSSPLPARLSVRHVPRPA